MCVSVCVCMCVCDVCVWCVCVCVRVCGVRVCVCVPGVCMFIVGVGVGVGVWYVGELCRELIFSIDPNLRVFPNILHGQTELTGFTMTGVEPGRRVLLEI